MIFRLMNQESKTLVGAAMIVGVLSFVSRLVGLVRDRILAGEFGAGDVLDAYYAAFKLPDLLFSMIVIGSLSASFIPLFTNHYRASMSTTRAWRLTNNTLHLVVAGMAVVSILLAVFAAPVAGFIAPGFPAYKHAMVVDFMRVMLLAQVILAASVVYGSALQGMKRFLLYSSAPVLYNLGIIIGALFLVDVLGPIGLAWGVVLGAALHLAVQVAGVLHAGYRYTWRFDLRDADTRKILLLAGPRMLGVGVSQINVVIFTVIATTLAIGSVTVFQFAYNIQFFPVGIIGVAYAVAAFPSFSEHVARQDGKGFRELFSATVRQVVFFLVPLMMLFLIVRAQIVRVIVGAGAFDWPATVLTADTLAFFAFSFVPQALVFVLARAFFAFQDTVTPLMAGLVSGLVGILAALWLVRDFGVVGLGMAFSLSAFVNLALLWVHLRQRAGSLDEARITTTLLKVSASAVPAAVLMQALKAPLSGILPIGTFYGIFLQGLLAGGAGLALYALIAWLLRTEELFAALEGLRRKVLRKSAPAEAFSTESPTAS